MLEFDTEVITTAALAVFLLKELYQLFRNSYRENTKALQETTIAISELKIELRHINDKLNEIPKLREDLDRAHSDIRELRLHPHLQKSLRQNRPELSLP